MIPSIVQNAQLQQIQYEADSEMIKADAVNAALEMKTTDSKTHQKCNVSNNGTVPLLKWPMALICWMQELRRLSLKDIVQINFNNAQ